VTGGWSAGGRSRQGTARLIERARTGAEALARSGTDVATFAAELAAHLHSVVPHSAACVVTLDPATQLLTGTYKFGGLAGRHDLDGEWAELEYGSDDPTRMAVRMRTLIRPVGYHDELRMVARSDGQSWGGVNLFRDGDGPPFSDEEVAIVGSLSEAVAEGIRSGLVARSAVAPDAAARDGGPLVLVVDRHSNLHRVSTGAPSLLDELSTEPSRSPAESTIRGLVAHTRRFARGLEDAPPRARLRLPSGRWLVANAAPLAGSQGPTGEIVVTIDDARPPEIVPLLAAAFGLTDREREVTQLVLTGTDTKGIAAALSMSTYTVQDHLKSVFDKSDVRSRRELMARVFFDQYAPRLTEEVGPSGWFQGH
jgi:DNA-binding CsgD family transcriptional regulator